MRSKYLAFEILLFAVVLAATIWAYPHLPARVAVHWGFHGQVNGRGPRRELLLINIGGMLFLMALAHLGPWLSPKQFSVESFYTTFRQVILMLMAMLAYMSGVVLWVNLGHTADVLRVVFGGTFLFFVMIGNVMGKIRRNYYLGVRTPWTLASERVWNATHRFAAKVNVALGLAGLALTLACPLRLVVRGMVGLIVAALLTTVLYSLVYYKRLERAGEL